MATSHKKKADWAACESVVFSLIVTSYNNEEWCERNLSSIFRQSYPHWELYYIDDASIDGTLDLVHQLIKQYGVQDKCFVHRNVSRQGAAANLYETIHSINPRRVAVLVDGDDWLAHPYVLDHLAESYHDPSVWMTHGSLVMYPSGKYFGEPLPEGIEQQGFLREYSWVTTHLKSFRVALFSKIKKEDFLYEGEFLPMASDVALMLPLLEMASKGHIRFMSEPLYIYNAVNPISDGRSNTLLQQKMAAYIRAKPPYAPLDRLD